MSQLMIEVILAHSRNRWLERRNSLTSSFRRIGEKVRRERRWTSPARELVRSAAAPTALSDRRAKREIADYISHTALLLGFATLNT